MTDNRHDWGDVVVTIGDKQVTSINRLTYIDDCEIMATAIFASQILKPIRVKVSKTELVLMCNMLKRVLLETLVNGVQSKATVWRAYKLLSRLDSKKFAQRSPISLTLNMSEAEILLHSLSPQFGGEPRLAVVYMNVESQIL